MKTILLSIFSIAISTASSAQITSAWNSSTGNLQATNSIGYVATGNYKGGNIQLQAGNQSPIQTSFAGIKELQPDKIITVYPNPASNLLTVDAEAKTIKILNTLGQVVLTSSDKTIDISSLESGTYIVLIDERHNTVFIKN